MFSPTRPKDTLEDIWDGSNVAENALFQSDPKSLGLILYQDAFEVANPLGSGKRKHKVLAVYFSLADMAPHNRSSVDQMQLALLCREQDYKYFGHDKVFSSFIRDLKDLEENGLVMSDGQVYSVPLLVTTWDHTMLVVSIRTSASVLTSADSVILIVKHSLPLPWQKAQSGQLNPTMTMCSSWLQQA